MVTSAYMPDVRVEVAFDAGVRTPAASRTWTDVSTYVELQNGIEITRGRDGGLSTTSPSTMSLTLDNSDGRFTPGRSSSPYYPNVKLGRPIRVSTLDVGVTGNFLDVNQATFESATSVSDWWTAGGSVPPTLSRSSTHPHDASFGMLVTWGTGGTLPLAQTLVTGLVVGREYTASAYGWVPTGSPSIRVVMNGQFGTVMSTKNADTRFSVTFTASASSHQLQIWPSTAPTAGQQAWVDTLQVWEGAAVVPITTVPASTAISTRFTGYVDEWPVSWSQGIEGNSVAELTASGRLARLGEGAELRSIVETEILLDDPVAYYPLGEAEGATHATEFTGSDLIGMYSYYGGTSTTTVGFGAGIGPRTDGLPAPLVYPTLTGDTTPTALAAYWTLPMTQCTIEVFAAFNSRNTGESVQVITLLDNPFLNSANANFLQVVASTSSSTTATTLGAYTEQDDSGGFGEVFAAGVADDDAFDGSVHHYALTFVPGAGAARTVEYYYDGVLQGTATGTTIGTLTRTTMPTWNLFYLGPLTTATGDFPFSVAHAVVYDQVLDAARIAAHANAGLSGFLGELAADRIERYAGYAGIEASQVVSDAGVVALSHIDTTSKTPEALIRTIEDTENGIVYDAREGTLKFRDRNSRYQAASAFTLDAAQQHIEADGLRPILDRSLLINEVTARSSDGTVERRYVDTAAADETGPRRVDLELASTDQTELYNSAAWRVNKYKDPKPRIAALAPVDILPLGSSPRDAIRDADISTKFTVSNLPSQAPTTSQTFFVEGITETLGPESWRFQFNVSSADVYENVWVLGDASHGQLGTTTILAL